jgi:hypothetical protein
MTGIASFRDLRSLLVFKNLVLLFRRDDTATTRPKWVPGGSLFFTGIGLNGLFEGLLLRYIHSKPTGPVMACAPPRRGADGFYRRPTVLRFPTRELKLRRRETDGFLPGFVRSSYSIGTMLRVRFISPL